MNKNINKNINNIHPHDLSLSFLNKNSEQQKMFLKKADIETIVSLFENIETEEIVKCILMIDNDKLKLVINTMSLEELTILLKEVETDMRFDLYQMLESTRLTNVIGMLKYDLDIVGFSVDKSFLKVFDDQNVLDVKKKLVNMKKVTNINYLYVVDQVDHLLGIISLKEIFIWQDQEKLIDIMKTNIKSVKIWNDKIIAAKIIRDYNLSAIPVINDDNKIQGVISVEDVVDILNEEAEENIVQISGANIDEKSAHTLKNVYYRLPWLLLLMLLTMFNSLIYQNFEGVLTSYAILAIYMPFVAAMSGNVGSQVLGLTIHKMSYDSNHLFSKKMIVHYAFREVKVYFVSAFILNIFIFLILGLFAHQYQIAITLCITISITFIISSLLGALVPILMEKFKINSKIASGPLITTMNDLFSIVIYLSVGYLLFSI